jgi:hypothetical protein
VLTHEAIIDSTWDSSIKPLLLKRFPASTRYDLARAHGYAYGGSIIQDLGYYPFGSQFYSDLTHYVRSGDFILNLIRESQDLDNFDIGEATKAGKYTLMDAAYAKLLHKLDGHYAEIPPDLRSEILALLRESEPAD